MNYTSPSCYCYPKLALKWKSHCRSPVKQTGTNPQCVITSDSSPWCLCVGYPPLDSAMFPPHMPELQGLTNG